MISRFKYFAAFTAVFAVCAVWLFWGTWSPDFVPVMPDCGWNYPNAFSEHLANWWRGWVAGGNFVPDDLKAFLGSPWLWSELQYALALYCAALGLAYFLSGRGLPPLAAYGAGLLLAFCGYWCTLFSAGHLGWFRWMTYGVFAFGLIDRAVLGDRLRHWLMLGACVAWASFYQPDLWLIFTLFTAIYFLYRCVRERRLPWKGALFALLAFALIGAPSFYNAFHNALAGRKEQIAQAEGEKKVEKEGGGGEKGEDDAQWIFATNWSLPPAEIAEFFLPRLNGDTSCVLTQALSAKAGHDIRPYTGALGRAKDAKSGNYRQHSLYVGFITCLLALFALARRYREVDVVFFAAAATTFLVFSLGRFCEPVYRLVYALPFGDYLRAPVKWHHLTEFCLCVLAGYGIAELYGMLSKTKLKPAVVTAITAAVVLLGVANLVNDDHRYCAPVDMRQAKAKDADMQFNFLHRSQFSNPQVSAMVKAGLVQSLAYFPGNRDVYLVGILTPRKHERVPTPPWSLATWLGLVSVLSSLLVAVLVVGACRSAVGAKLRVMG